MPRIGRHFSAAEVLEILYRKDIGPALNKVLIFALTLPPIV